MFEIIHKAGYIYLNIKGDNISLLYESIKKSKFINHITIINYCFCTKYNGNDNLLLPKEKATRINENLYYSFVNSLSDKPVSYKDDILAMCYYLIYLYKGKLPWHALTGDNKDKDKKKYIQIKNEYTAKILCGNNLKEVSNIFDNSKDLEFSDKPNYNGYIDLFSDYITKETKKDPNNVYFDWDYKLIKLLEENGGIKKCIKHNQEIKDLFEGFQDFFVEIYLHKYLNSIQNIK